MKWRIMPKYNDHIENHYKGITIRILHADFTLEMSSFILVSFFYIKLMNNSRL
jgi:hypothetical protein